MRRRNRSEMKIYHKARWRAILLACIALLVIWIAGCGSLEMKSHWRTQPVEIDGRSTEWQNVLTRIGDKQVMVGLLNDSSDLYVCLVTDDRGLQRQIMFRGLTLWFDRQGGEDKKFGIRYPLGMQGSPLQTPGFISAQVPEQNMDDSSRDRFAVESNELEMLGPAENEHHRLSTADLKDVAVKATMTAGTLVYELKMPLKDNRSDPYAIGTQAGSVVGVGLETGERIERRGGGPGREGSEGGEGGGMGRGGRRGRGGFGGGGQSPRGGQSSEPLSVWAKVQLASGDSTLVR